MGALHHYSRILEILSELRRAWRRRELLIGCLRVGILVLVLTVALVLLDNLLHPGTIGRIGAALVGYGLPLIALLRWVIVPAWDDRRDDFFAALLEQRRPDLRNRLINALQLGRGDQAGHSPILIDAIVTDAVRAAADIEVEDALERGPLRRLLPLLGTAIGLPILYAVGFGDWFRNGLLRVYFPLAQIAPFTAVRLPDEGIVPGSKSVPEGDSFLISATTAGDSATSATLTLIGANGTTEIPMQPDPSDPRTFRVEVVDVRSSFDYFIRAGDGRSQTFRITVLERPRITDYQATLLAPAYLDGRRATSRSRDLAALPGTTIHTRLTAQKPLRSAEWLFDTGSGDRLIVPGRISPDGATAEASFIASVPKAILGETNGVEVVSVPRGYAQYQVRLIAQDGTANYAAAGRGKLDPPWHRLDLLTDQSPRGMLRLARFADLAPLVGGVVESPQPLRSVTRVLPSERLRFAVDAVDDFGLGKIGLRWYRVTNDAPQPTEVPLTLGTEVRADIEGEPLSFDLAPLGLRPNDLLRLSLEVEDRNTVTGPGRAVRREYTLQVVAPRVPTDRVDDALGKYIEYLAELLKLQTEVRRQTATGEPFMPLVSRQQNIRTLTNRLARELEADTALRMGSLVRELDELRLGDMASAVKLLEDGAAAQAPDKADSARSGVIPVMDRIIETLKAMLARLERNEQARKTLERLAKTDKPGHQQAINTLAELIKQLDAQNRDTTKTLEGFERLIKKPNEELSDAEKQEKLKEAFDEFSKRTQQWKKDTVNEMTKLPQGFIKDFDLRADLNRVYEEIEGKARSKAEKLEVSLEDLGVGLSTKMKEDLESWLPDAADNIKWMQEEPMQNKPFQIPEMPLPKGLEDLIGDLLQKAEEFDEEADDTTSAWGDNLDQAGWGTSDGPISIFSAKGKTGNDQPNNQEVTGRSGDGRRGKSTGQMVGDTSRALPGRKTPARVGNERYEPGQLKQEGNQDPNGATGGGKKAGAGRIGLQGGTMPEVTPDLGRLNAKQMGLREKMEQVARKLEERGIRSERLRESIDLMKQLEQANADLRYDDVAKKRKEAVRKLRTGLAEVADSTAGTISRAPNLPPELRRELSQGSAAGPPAGYEKLFSNFLKKVAEEKPIESGTPNR